MILNSDKCKYLRILVRLKERNANLFTQKELAKHLGCSERKINSFLNGKVYDFWLLSRFAAILGMKLNFYI